eukprot:INCI7190.2.p1 GENE.INCI7190.2~~INCI7190.2.p1  ORF type:complete len:519 (+),score=117.82 INCI7190.2:90-1646(+)
MAPPQAKADVPPAPSQDEAAPVVNPVDADLPAAENENADPVAPPGVPEIIPNATNSRTMEELRPLVQTLTDSSSDPAAVLQATQRIRKYLSMPSKPPIKEVVELNAIPPLVELLKQDDNRVLQYEALWALTNIASSELTVMITKTEPPQCADAVPEVIRLLQCPDDKVREQAIWCVGNIAGDGPAMRDRMLAEPGLVAAMVQNFAAASTLSLARNAAWTLSNLVRGKPQPPLSKVAGLVPVMASAAQSVDDDETLTDVCWALSYLSDGEDARIECIIQTGILPKLVSLLNNPKYGNGVKVPALRTIGNIVTGNDKQTQAAIEAGAIGAVAGLLSSDKASIRKEAIWAISNVAAGNAAQVNTVAATVDPKTAGSVVHTIVNILNTGMPPERKEAAWVLSNMTSGGSLEVVGWMLQDANLVQTLSNAMTVFGGARDWRLAAVCLEGIDNVLRTISSHPSQESLLPLQKQIAQYLRDNDYLEFLQSAENAPESFLTKGQGLISRCEPLLGDETEDVRLGDE